jgi:hypothetical protein
MLERQSFEFKDVHGIIIIIIIIIIIMGDSLCI